MRFGWTRLTALFDLASSEPNKILRSEQSTVKLKTSSVPVYWSKFSSLESFRNLLESASPGDTENVRVHALAYILNQVVEGLPGYIDATIPHDYIYGILAMTRVSKVPEYLAPDYSIPFSKVFHAYAQVMLEYTGDLSLISRRENFLGGVPTWVPDFRYARHRSEDMTINWASPELDTGVRIIDNGNTCSAPGVRLGAVVLTDRYPSNPVDRFNYGYEVRNSIRLLDSFLNEVSLLTKMGKDAIIAACLSSWFSPDHGGQDPFVLKRTREFYDCAISRVPLPGLSSERKYDSDIADKFDTALAGHSLLLTSRGVLGRLKSQNKRAVKGDVLAVMKSASNPYLFRPTKVMGEYTFIGSGNIFYAGGCELGTTEDYFAKNKVETFRIV